MFSKIVLCLFFTGAALSAPTMTSAANLRSSKVGFPRNLSTASECTIMVASDIRILEGVSEHLEEDSFECEMAAEDMDMESGQMLRLRVNQGQLAQLKKMLKDGDLIPGESKLVHGANASFSRDGLFVPPGLDIATNVRKNVNKKRRRLAKTLGTKPILVVKVTDNGGLTRAESPAVIGDDIFGTLGDPVNLASQMKACSFGQLDIVPGDISPLSKQAAPGVIEVTIPMSLTGNDRYAIHNAVTSAVNAKLGISLPGPYEQVMYVVEKCYVNCGYAAYAYINSWMSVYVDRYYKQVGVQMHELGHSFNLAHSGGLNGATYTDHTGLMGNPLYSDDVGKMCFNAAKNWQLNWYNDKKLLVNPLINPTTIVDLVGIANYDTTANSHPVVVKIETGTSTDQFIGFNRAVGINAQNDEADNEVTIVQTGNNGENYSQSQLKAHLIQGESYTFLNWDNVHDLIITALDIDLGVNQAVDIAVARVSITLVLTSAPTKAPSMAPVTSAPTKTPSKAPVTSTPTKAPVTSAPTKAPVTSAPTKTPSKAPVTSAPTKTPSKAPVTSAPTKTPSKAPVTSAPTEAPVTSTPTKAPVTSAPTKTPSKAPVTSAPTTAPVTSAPTTAPVTSAPTKAPVTSTPTKAPSKAPVTSAPTRAPVQCSSLTGRGGNDCKDATGCSWIKFDKICIPDSAADIEPAGCNSYTDEGSQACRAAIGCTWFGSKCI